MADVECSVKMDLRWSAEMVTSMKNEYLQTAKLFMLTKIRERFRRQEAPDGTRWQPLSPLTIRLKGDSKPFRSFIHDIVATIEGSKQLTVMCNNIYAAWHNEGRKWIITTKQSVWMFYNLLTEEEQEGRSPFWKAGKTFVLPKRTFIGFSPSDEESLEQLAKDIFSKKFEE